MALRETPAAQCTRTLPPSSRPFLMKAMPAGKCLMSTADSTSNTGIVKWDLVLSGGSYGDSAITDSICAYSLPCSRDPRPPSHSPACSRTFITINTCTNASPDAMLRAHILASNDCRCEAGYT